jgi:LacI family transcriptional regulator
MGKYAIELITKEIQMQRNNQPIKYNTHVMETSLVLRESTLGKSKKVPSY